MKTLATSTLLLVCTYMYGADAIRLKISGNNYSDETLIRFMDGADNGFDNNYDATKMFSFNKNVPAIYSMVDAVNPLVVNSYPLLIKGGVKTNIFVRNYIATTYTISCEEFGTISPDACIYMEDIKTGSFYDLRRNASHTFQLQADSASNTPRFVVHFSVPSALSTSAASCTMSNNGSISISKPNWDTWNYQLSDVSGKIVKTGFDIYSSTTIDNLYPNNYILTIFSKYGCPENFTVTVPVMNSIKSSFISSADAVRADSAIVAFTNQSENAVKYLWDFGDQHFDSLSANPTHSYSKAGSYIVKLTVVNGACSDVSQKTIEVLPSKGVTTGIGQDYTGKKIKIFNSAEGLMIAMPDKASDKTYTISVYNSIGQLLYNEKTESSGSNYLLSGFNSRNNILIVQVRTTGELFSEKIVTGE